MEEEMDYKIGALTGGYFPLGGYTGEASGYTGDSQYSGDFSGYSGEVSWLSGDNGI
jgi:hypothetical protein